MPNTKGNAAEHSPVAEKSWFGPPSIIPGEDLAAYEQIRTQIRGSVKPQDFLEEMWIHDIMVRQWEILRLRRVKDSMVRCAISTRLKDVLEEHFSHYEPVSAHGETSDSKKSKLSLEEHQQWVKEQATELFNCWAQHQQQAIKEVDAALAEESTSLEEILNSVFMEDLKNIEMLEQLIAMAEHRRDNALHEIERHRTSVMAAIRGSISRLDTNETWATAPKLIEGLTPNENDCEEVSRKSSERKGQHRSKN